MPPRKKRFVWVCNHFDLTWRRANHTGFVSGGRTYAPYTAIHDGYVRENLALCRTFPEYKFEVESVAVLRGCLRRHPEWKEELIRLGNEGRFGVCGTGDNIVDANMILGESLVRNFLLGQLWLEREFGRKPRVCSRKDAFGNSAQLPQICLGCEFDRIVQLSYTVPRGSRWRGLDGSEISIAELPVAGTAHGIAKLRPCPGCGGTGCAVCGETGMELRRVPPPSPDRLDAAAETAKIVIAPEEMLPNPEIETWFRELCRHCDARFMLSEEEGEFLPADASAALHPSVELNPNNTGCYVSRIGVKQTCRRQEYTLLKLETLAAAHWLESGFYPAEKFQLLWEDLLFTLFHDAVTGTHVDAANEELRRVASGFDRRADRLAADLAGRLAAEPAADGFTIMNLNSAPFTGLAEIEIPAGQTVTLPEANGAAAALCGEEPVSAELRRVRLLIKELAPGAALYCGTAPKPASPPTAPPAPPENSGRIENRRFRIEFDEGGISRIFDKKQHATLSERGTYRPFEILLENDQGSPWATLVDSMIRYRGKPARLAEVRREPLVESVTLDISVEDLTFAGGNPLEGRMTIRLYRDLEEIHVAVDLARWDCYNARLRLALPLPFRGRHFCEIPYGTLPREAYAPDFHWNGASGDWPAVNWCGVEGDALSVALFNRGTPSCKLEDDGAEKQTLLISFLRSPASPTFLHEPWDYSMTDFDGMRDAGSHHFDFAVTAYKERFADSSVVADAENYVSGPVVFPGRLTPPPLPRIASESVRIAAIKRAETGDALIVRLFEYRGKGGEAAVTLPDGIRTVRRTNLLERGGTVVEITAKNRVVLTLRPWEIATLRCEPAAPRRAADAGA